MDPPPVRVVDNRCHSNFVINLYVRLERILVGSFRATFNAMLFSRVHCAQRFWLGKTLKVVDAKEHRLLRFKEACRDLGLESFRIIAPREIVHV
jgi:hypothetical protein